MRGALGWVVLGLWAGAMAQERKHEIFLGDGAVGDAITSQLPDGKLLSKAKMKIGTLEISSDLTLGRDTQGKLNYVRIVEKAGPNSGDILIQGGKVTLNQNGKDVALPARPMPLAVFSPYHPIAWETMISAMKPNGKIKSLDLQTLSDIEVPFTASEDSLNGKKIVRTASKLGALTIEFAHDGKNVLGMRIEAQKYRATAVGYADIFVDPMAKFPELSQATMATIAETLTMTTRDGVKLVADVVRPAAEGRYPVILTRTPYGRAAGALMGTNYAKRGYAYISQDVRGTGDSDGKWDPFNSEREDGYDTLDWVISQPWAQANVGMIGASYGGYVQWAAAVTKHPALKCIIPQVSPPEPTRNVPWDNGAWLLTGNVWWTRIVKGKNADMSSIGQKLDSKALNTLPLSKIDDKMLGASVPFYDEWLRRDDPSKWPGAYTTAKVGQTRIPTLHISGTWDGDGVGTQLHWTARRAAGNISQWLIFGPWDHAFNSSQKFGDVDFGAGSILELDSVYLRWFDHWLKEKPVGIEKVPSVKFFVTGANKWLETTDWPAPAAIRRTFALAGSPRLNGPLGELHPADPIPGSFRSSGPLNVPKRNTLSQNPVTFAYDPAKIKLTEDAQAGGGTTKATQKELTKDWISFQTAPFTSARTFAGTLSATLLVSTSAKDATFYVVPLDRAPDGNFRVISQPGKMRMAYRNGQRESVTPGQAYQITIEPWWFAHEFKKGHRLVLAIGCNTFPGYARNPGTGEPDFSATKLVRANQTIHLKKSSVSLWEVPIR